MQESLDQEKEGVYGWAVEKASRSLEALSKASDALGSDIDTVSREDISRISGLVNSAIYDASKILAYVTKSHWDHNDARDIQNHGHGGYERVAAKYGVIHRTSEQQKVMELAGFVDELAKLLSGRRENRTLIHEMLNVTPLKHPLVEKTRTLVELVTQGELEWEDFCLLISARISALKLK